MIYFMRHGLDDETYVGGWSDVDLVPEGIEQVKKTIENLKDSNIKIEKIIASDIKRAIHTSKIASDILNVNDIEYTNIFREQNKGILNGMVRKEADFHYPKFDESIVAVDTKYIDGESLRDLYNRIKDNMDYINSIPDNTLIVTHRGVINMLYYILNNIPLDMNKKRFDVTHASIHEYDKEKALIRKVL